MTGRALEAEAGRQEAGGGRGFARRLRLPSSASRLLPPALSRGERGFTLLELMIVISVIIILAVIVMPQYLRTVQQAREATLRDDLFQMRKVLDQYAADKGRLPQSLDDLVTAGYLREVPVDPMTEGRDWNVETGQDPLSADGGSGVTDVRSSSSEIGSDGRPYNQW